MNQTKTTRFSVAMFGTMLMLAFQLFSGSANAVNVPISNFICSVNPTPTATTSCVTGFFSAGWQSGGYWEYTLNTTGFSTINVTFKNQKSSAAGPTTGQVVYQIGTGGTEVSVGLFTVTTGCVQQTFTLPAACNNKPLVFVRVKMSGATASTATHRISSTNVFDGTSTACTTAPTAGTVTAATSSVCQGISSTLNLTGATGGAGISYQWQSSPNNSSWSPIAGATGTSYDATPAATTYYRVVVTCAGHGSNNSSSDTVVVKIPNIGTITPVNDPTVIEDGAYNVLASNPGGIWASSNTGVATIDAGGLLTPVFGGHAVISYQAVDPANGCVGTLSEDLNVIWRNTIALYAGENGNSTNVMNVPGDQTTDLTAVGFGGATPCGSGGLSGLTVPVTDTVYDPANPYVSFKIGADAGNVLNMYRIQARLRVSATGPTKARIAYNAHFTGSGWTGLNVENDDHDLVDGGCGSSANVFDFNSGSTVNPNPTVFGADSIEVRVYPFKPGAATGTFQANTLEVYGVITTNTLCGDLPITSNTADSVLPALINICDSGSRFLNYNLGNGGNAGVGVSLQWQESANNGGTWTDITGATGAVYQTATFHAGVGSDTMMYRVKVVCSGNTGFSAPNLIAIHSKPTIPAFTGGTAATAQLPFRHMLIGTPATLTPAVGFTGGTWSSNDTSSISINATSGLATPHIPGDAIITYSKSVNGCFGSVKDTFVSYYPNTKALYVGRNGNSVNVYAAANTTAANLSQVNFGSATGCSNGGVSGMTQTDAAQNQATNGRVVTTVGSTSGSFTVNHVYATVRTSTSGTSFMAYLGYKLSSASTWSIDPTPVSVDIDDCGYSVNALSFAVSGITVTPAASADFAVFAFGGGASSTFQVNAMDVTGTGGSFISGKGINVFANSNIQLYPNPVNNTLNISATEKVNVAIYSIDGKKLIEQNSATSIDVSSLVSGMYMIQVYSSENNTLLKTDKFVKK